MARLPDSDSEREELERLGELYIERALAAGQGAGRELAEEGVSLAQRMKRAAMDLGMSRATEFSPWIWRLDLMAAKLALLALGPSSDELRHYEGGWGFDRYLGKHRVERREYHRFRLEYIAGDGLLEVVRGAWGWLLPEPREILTMSLFGNLLVQCEGGTIWRIRPEELQAKHVTRAAEGLEPRFRDEEFRSDWEAVQWVEAAREALGPVGVGECYGFRVWPLLGGEYAVENMVIKSVLEWIEVSGEVAERSDGLPEGAKLELDVE